MNKLLIFFVVVLVGILGTILYVQLWDANEPYYAVYFDTGDVYFGKLHYFPRRHLTEVWFLQRNPNDAQNPMSIAPLAEVFWGPEDTLMINDKKIVWKARLKNDSPVVAIIKNGVTAQAPNETELSTGQ